MKTLATRVKDDWCLRIISLKTAHWLGMAAAVLGGWIAVQHEREHEDGTPLGGLLMLVPVDHPLAEEGRPADEALELERLRRAIDLWSGLDDQHADVIRHYLATATGGDE